MHIPNRTRLPLCTARMCGECKEIYVQNVLTHPLVGTEVFTMNNKGHMVTRSQSWLQFEREILAFVCVLCRDGL